MTAAQVFGAEMRIKSVSNEQLRKLGMPLGASVVAAVGTMFVPTGLLETITGSTGLSELIPATAAPLGDTARALIAFGAGAFTLAAASLVTFRGVETAPRPAAPAPMKDRMETMQTKPVTAAKPSLADRIGNFRMPHIKLPKMPWIKGEGDVSELSDLKIRAADAHPDASLRRPLVATADLPTLDLADVAGGPVVVGVGPVEEAAPAIDPAKWYSEIAASTAPAAEPVVEAVAEPEPVVVEAPVVVEEPAPVVAEAPVFEAPVAETPAYVAPAPVAAPVASQPSLDDMLAQFEASIARRQEQLAAAPVAVAAPVVETPAEPEAVAAEPVEAEILPPVEEAPAAPTKRFATPLSAIPNANLAAEEMDSALAAALATLQRMNGTSR